MLSAMTERLSTIFKVCGTVATLALAASHSSSRALAGDGLETIDFNRDVRPIFAGSCLECHGPDPNARQAELRLDLAEDIHADRGGYRVIDLEQPEQSELLVRVASDDPEMRMPPGDSSHDRLSEQQVEVLRRWIEQGASWAKHWAFVPPQKPALPAVSEPTWPRNGLDHFVLARLDRAGLAPSPEADRVTLIRRVTLALTGLPPTIAQVDSFVADPSPDAYEKVVDRLLDSPRYGEHMAMDWLDAARYSDSSGYQADWERYQWPWRDWVVDAYNANLPFDQFTIEQLAGDLLPGATLSQKIATGFNRNHRINDEGGSLDAEFEVEYVVDRVDTTATVWLGLSAGCARCHDHKYDPISQKEFYQLYAFFNNVPERGIDGRHGAAKPFIEIPNEPAVAKLEESQAELEKLEVRLKKLTEVGASDDEGIIARVTEDVGTCSGASGAAQSDANGSHGLRADGHEVLEHQIDLLKKQIRWLERNRKGMAMVMQELPERRPTYLLKRGDYQQPDTTEVLFPALPRIFGSLPGDAPPDRLALARWIVGTENPLTARVTVNKLWQHHFGTGIVRTAEDFGSRGQRPSHPELLDWLATEFVQMNWNLKAMHRMIVTSATYRQSHINNERFDQDPGNRLMSRGPRQRLTGAAIRDQGLVRQRPAVGHHGRSVGETVSARWTVG